jgi:hypothetical protein
LEQRLPGKQSQPVVELCGVLGRLHSSQGLAQANNNTKLNYSAKYETTLLETSGKQRRAKRERVRLKKGKFLICLDLFFFLESSKTDNMNREDLKHQKMAHTFSESTGVFR